jgi:hypothetical protein
MPHTVTPNRHLVAGCCPRSNHLPVNRYMVRIQRPVEKLNLTRLILNLELNVPRDPELVSVCHIGP